MPGLLNLSIVPGRQASRCFGKALTVGGLINIAGVDDPTARFFDLATSMTEKEILSPLPAGKFTLLLKHRPIISKESIGLFDLHSPDITHKGQIFPFSLVTRLYYPSIPGFWSW